MAGYIRNDVTNQISDTNVINAAPLNGEFDAVEAAFDAISGHRHDGTASEGAPITVIGPTQDVVATASALRPKIDDTVDLGTPSLKFKDLYVDGVAYVDALDINGTRVTATANQLNALSNDDRIINGAFDVWQRGASGTVNGYTAADRWANFHLGGTVTQSRQAQPIGTLFGANNPAFFLRQGVTGQSLSTHFASTVQRIEDVRTYAGQTITIMGWARRNSGTGNMAVEVIQNFGTGGGFSPEVTGIGSALVTLTGSWAPFAVTMSVPSVTGKTSGTDGNSYFGLVLWSSGGSDFNARSASLGIQTIGVDLWGVHIRVGTFTTADVATYVETPLGEVLAQCQRFYETGFGEILGYATGGVAVAYKHAFKVTKRSAPTLTYGINTTINVSTFDVRNSTPDGLLWYSVAAATGGTIWAGTWTASAEL